MSLKVKRSTLKDALAQMQGTFYLDPGKRSLPDTQVL